jgi:hypothetical protein
VVGRGQLVPRGIAKLRLELRLGRVLPRLVDRELRTLRIGEHGEAAHRRDVLRRHDHLATKLRRLGCRLVHVVGADGGHPVRRDAL